MKHLSHKFFVEVVVCVSEEFSWVYFGHCEFLE